MIQLLSIISSKNLLSPEESQLHACNCTGMARIQVHCCTLIIGSNSLMYRILWCMSRYGGRIPKSSQKSQSPNFPKSQTPPGFAPWLTNLNQGARKNLTWQAPLAAKLGKSSLVLSHPVDSIHNLYLFKPPQGSWNKPSLCCSRMSFPNIPPIFITSGTGSADSVPVIWAVGNIVLWRQLRSKTLNFNFDSSRTRCEDLAK